MTMFPLTKQIETVNQHDADAFAAFYTPDATVADPQYPGPLRGRDAIRQDMTAFMTAFPDLSFSLETVAEGDGTIAFEGVCKGTNTGPILSPDGEIPATNKPMTLPFASFLRVNDRGLISAERRYYDVAGLFQQLGLSDTSRVTA